MSVQVRNTKEYISPDKFRFVGLIYGLPGVGKTEFLGSVPDIGIAACETGEGNGLLTIAEKGVDHINVESLDDLETFAKGKIFPNKTALGLDSLTASSRGPIKNAALKIPRGRGESEKRRIGIPELDDYGSIAELTRQLLLMLINSNPTKHIVVTATEKYDRPNENDPPGTESLIGPELAGQMFLAAPAMFDFVLRLRTRAKLRDPKDAKSRYTERYFVTQQESGVVAKSRAARGGKAILDREEIFDLSTGQGTFPYLLNKIIKGYGIRSEEVAAAGK